MNEQERKEIIECLVFQSKQFEADKPRIDYLINVLKKVNCKSDFSDLQKVKVKDLILKCCDIVDYEITTANNASRQPILVEKRRAVSYFVFIANDEAPEVFYPLAEVFEKDRTSFNHHVAKAERFIQNNDRVFMKHFELLKDGISAW